MNFILVKVLGILIFSIVFCGADVEEIYTWNYVEYENLPKPDDYYVTPDEPYYVRGNTNVQGIGYHASTGLFVVAVARARRGVPSTVNAFCADKYKKGSNGPKVWGFPNYEINELKAEYFDAQKRSIRSAEEDHIQKKSVDVAKVEKPEFKVKIENDEVLKIETHALEAKGAQNSEDEDSYESLDEDSGKTGNFANKHKDKDRNKYGSNHNYHQKPTHTYVQSKPHHTHDSYNRPQYIHVTSKPHGSHASKPNYHHTNKPDDYYDRPSHSSSKPPKPHKNKYGTLSQIHSVHSHASKPVHYVPLPYKEEPTQPPTIEKYPTKPVQPDKNFVSVFHPVIDDVCDRVWFLDTGAVKIDGEDFEIQLASIWVINLPRTGKCGEGPYSILRHFEIPKSTVQVGGGLSNIALDYKKGGTCDDVFGYFPNLFTAKINVYDYKNNKAWSFHEHFSFNPVVSTALYTLEGEEFTDEMGVFSITLGWRDARGYRTAYYISPTTTVQFAVSTEVLKQEDLAPTSYNPDDFRPLGNRGCGTQALTHVFDSKNGVIFYGDRNGLSLRCWNVRKPPTPDYIDVVYYDPNFVFIHEITIDERGYLWALSNRLPFYFKYGFDTNKVNVRLYRVHVDEAVKNTVCANDDDEYRATGVFDYPKELPDFILQA